MRRALRVVATVVLVLVGVGALLVGGTLTLLRTRWGGDFVRRQAVPRVNAAIAGSLELGRFGYHGDRLELGDVVLRDPDGREVLRARAIDVSFVPPEQRQGRAGRRPGAAAAPGCRGHEPGPGAGAATPA